METKEVYGDLLISMLLPAIMEKWPRRDRLSRKIFIQQDRAKTHIHDDDKDFKDALMKRVSMQNSTHKQQAPLMLTCWIWGLSEPSRVSMMPHQNPKRNRYKQLVQVQQLSVEQD